MIDIVLIKKDTGEVILSVPLDHREDVIIHNDYELVDAPHEFVDIDGKIYLKTRHIM